MTTDFLDSPVTHCSRFTYTLRFLSVNSWIRDDTCGCVRNLGISRHRSKPPQLPIVIEYKAIHCKNRNQATQNMNNLCQFNFLCSIAKMFRMTLLYESISYSNEKQRYSGKSDRKKCATSIVWYNLKNLKKL